MVDMSTSSGCISLSDNEIELVSSQHVVNPIHDTNNAMYDEEPSAISDYSRASQVSVVHTEITTTTTTTATTAATTLKVASVDIDNTIITPTTSTTSITINNRYGITWLLQLLVYPLRLCIENTIIDVTIKSNRKWYPVTIFVRL